MLKRFLFHWTFLYFISEKVSVTSGVPQCCIVGPLLSVIFINDTAEDLEVPYLLYGNDTGIF